MSKLAGWASKGFRAAPAIVLALVFCARGLAAPGEETPKAAPAQLGEEQLRVGKEGIGPAQMTRVEHVAVDRDGYVYLGDWELGRVQRFSPGGKLDALVYVNSGRVDSLAFERSGVLFVAAGGQLFRYEAKSLTLLGEVERSEGDAYLAVAPRPDGGVIAILKSNSIYDGIAFMDREGKIDRVLQGVIDKMGGYILQDPAVAVDRRGFFYLADNGNHAIFKFSPEGRYVSRFGYEGHPSGDSSTDFQGIAIDSQDRLWVAGSHSLNLLALDGRPRRSYEMSAYGLAVNDKDELYVADWTQVRRYASAKP